MSDAERYEEICQPAFEKNEESHDRIEGKIDDILSILKGKDGEPGICERLRKVEAAIVPDLTPRLERVEWFQRGLIGSVALIVGAILTQVGSWIWERFSG